MAVFFIAFFFTFLYPLLYCTPLSFYIFLFLFHFSLIGIGRWMLCSRMGEGYGAGGNKPGFQYSGFRPIFL